MPPTITLSNGSAGLRTLLPVSVSEVHMRKNPTITTERTGLSLPEGIELPLASSVSSEVLADGNKMPEVNMTPNDGSNPSIPDAPFANGKNPVSHSGGPSSNPAPAKPGA